MNVSYLDEIQSDEICDTTDVAEQRVYCFATGQHEVCTNRFGIADIDQLALVEQCLAIRRVRVETTDGWEWQLALTLTTDDTGAVVGNPDSDVEIESLELNKRPTICGKPVNGKLTVAELQERLAEREANEIPLFNESEYDGMYLGNGDASREHYSRCRLSSRGRSLRSYNVGLKQIRKTDEQA